MTNEWLAGVGVALLLTTPANYLVRWILRISRRAPLPEDVATGRWIGGLERLLIFVLVVAGDPAAAGLVVAAKSILRFPEITNVNSRICPDRLAGLVADRLQLGGADAGAGGLTPPNTNQPLTMKAARTNNAAGLPQPKTSTISAQVRGPRMVANRPTVA